MLSFLRRMRHGPLKGFDPAWLFLGRLYRKIVRWIPGLSVRQSIGPYGPFRLLPEFTFSDLENWGGAHNKGFVRCIEACRGKSCVLDVGAHIGLVTLPAASVMAEGGVLYAFEPAVANEQILHLHLKLNGCSNVVVTQSLAGDKDAAEVDFYESFGPHGQNAIVLKSKTTLISEHGGYSRTKRRQVSLDSFCCERKLAPEVIKIDVEGAELGVLEGAREILTTYRPVVYLSVHPREIKLAGRSLEELQHLIASLDYTLTTIDGDEASDLSLDEYLMVPVRLHD
jgi:FkbM family methyltransferase